MFAIGECVVCVDASELPSPPWYPLVCGAVYCIRAIEEIPEIDGNYDKNIHKHSRYLVRVWGITNPIHGVFGKELAYAATRFESIQAQSDYAQVSESARSDYRIPVAA
jgi:hypothetical protein